MPASGPWPRCRACGNRALDLSGNRITDDGAEALVSSAYLRQLRHLRLQDNRFTDVVHLLLTERFGDVVVV